MSRKRTANTGWESDEEDLLMNDGGISAFKNEDDEIDEEALLGLGDDDGTDANYLQAHDSGAGDQGGFEDQQDELLEIGVDEEEIEELVVGDDHFEVNKNDGLEEENEQLDYNDDLPQTDDVHVEYDNEVADFNTAERDVIQEEPQEASHTESSLSYAQDESDNQNISTVEATGDSESESEDSDGEKHRRGRFKSERSNMISVSKVKSRTDIPDTLEVSAEQQAQLDQFPDNRSRDRGRYNNNNRGRGWGQQRGGFRGGRQDHGDNRQGGGPMRANRGRQHPFASPFPHNQMRPQGLPTPLMGRDASRLPHPGDRSMAQQFMGRPSAGPMCPQPLMRLQQGNRLQQGQGNRLLVPNQEGMFKFNMGAPQQGGMATLMPGQLPPGHPLQPRPQAPSQHPQLRPGLPMSASPPRPHNIHINPNFRGPTPGGPPASSTPPLGQPAFGQPNMTQVFRAPAAMDGPRPLMPGQPQRFGQPQGFQHGPHMGAPHHQPGLNMRAGQPQHSRFASPSSQGMGQPGLMGSPRHPASSAAGFPGQRLPPHHSQNQPQFPAHFNNNNNNNNNQPPQSQSMQHHNRSASPRFSAPQQGVFSRPSPPQQQQRRPGLFTAHAQRRMGAQPRGTTPVKVNAITTAKKLSQQARMTQQARAATQSVSKNITVVSLKRRSTDNSGSGEPPKVARTTEPSVASELCDEELQQGLEEQKRLREMIKKRKEEARRRQAELRRRELEARLAKQGLTIEDVERVGTMPSAETQPEHDPAAEDAGSVQQGAQRIMTVVSRGGKKQLTTPAKRQQQQQQHQQQPVTAQHPVQPQLASQPPQQFAGQHYQQQSAVFSSLPPQQQQQQQQQHNPGVFNNPGFAQQQQQQPFQPPQQPFQPVRQQQQPPQQMSPAPLAQSPFKSQPFQQNQQPPPAAPQQFQSPPPRGQFAQAAHGQFPPRQFEFQQPQPQPQQQHFLPHESGDAPGAAQHGRQQFQNRQAILGAVVGHGAARGMASGQVASVRGQGPTGRGQGAGGRGQVVRGRGQVGRGGGQLSRGRGMSAGVAASPQRAMSASSGPQASSNRVVIPVGGGRGIPQGAASALRLGRVVVQRQVVPRGASIKSKMVTSSAVQKVSIDNLAKGTQEFEIRQHCESVGPVVDVVMIESQQKAIVTFGSKAHAVQFAKQWNRRMVNLSLVSVTLLP